MSYCACEYGYCDIYEEIKRKANKNHVCDCCRECIEKGDEYFAINTLYDGEWSNLKVCDCCMEDGKNLRRLGFCFSWSDLEDVLREAYG